MIRKSRMKNPVPGSRPDELGAPAKPPLTEVSRAQAIEYVVPCGLMTVRIGYAAVYPRTSLVVEELHSPIAMSPGFVTGLAGAGCLPVGVVPVVPGLIEPNC